MKNLFNELSFRFRLMFLLAVLLLIVNLPLFYIINASIETDQSEMSRGQNMRYDVINFFSLLSDLEMRHRNYLLMPSHANGVEFRKSLMAVKEEKKVLSRSTFENPPRAKILMGLESRIGSRLKSLEQSALAREAGDVDLALKLLQLSEDNDELKKIRQKVAEIAHDENLMIADSQKKNGRAKIEF